MQINGQVLMGSCPLVCRKVWEPQVYTNVLLQVYLQTEEEYGWGRTQQGATRKDWENSEEQGVRDVICVGNPEATIGDDDRGLKMHMRLESQVSFFFFHSFCFTNDFCTISEL